MAQLRSKAQLLMLHALLPVCEGIQQKRHPSAHHITTHVIDQSSSTYMAHRHWAAHSHVCMLLPLQALQPTLQEENASALMERCQLATQGLSARQTSH